MKSPEMGGGAPETPKIEIKKVENIDSYEMEKIKNTLGDLKATVKQIEIFLEEVKKLDDQGIKASRSRDIELEKLRFPKGPAGPDNDILKIQVLFQRALVDLNEAKKININDSGTADDVVKFYEKK